MRLNPPWRTVEETLGASLKNRTRLDHDPPLSLYDGVSVRLEGPPAARCLEAILCRETDAPIFLSTSLASQDVENAYLLANFGRPGMNAEDKSSGDHSSSLNRAWSRARDTLEAMGQHHPCRLRQLCTLDLVADSLESIRHTIDLLREAIAATHPSHPQRPLLLECLAGILPRTTEEPTHNLDESISLLQEAVESADPCHPDLPRLLHNLGLTLSERFHSGGSLNDINDACDIHARAVAGMSSNGVCEIIFLNSFCGTLIQRFTVLGNLDDLDRAVQTAREAASLSAQPSSLKAKSLARLSGALSERYHYAGETEDLDCAIASNCETLSMECSEWDRALNMTNLADCLIHRYQRIHNAQDLDYAIELLNGVLQISVRGEPFHHVSLATLGQALRLQAECTKTNGLVTRSIALYLEALDECPSQSPLHLEYLLGTAVAYSTRLTLTGKPQDRSHAIQNFDNVLDAAAIGHRLRARCIFEKARFILQQVASNTEAIEALELLREAIADNYSSTMMRLLYAADTLPLCLRLATDAPELALPIFRLYAATLELLPRTALLGSTVHARLRSLVKAEALSLDAARLMMCISEPQRALEIMELGRASFWAQTLALRTSFDALPPTKRDEMSRLARSLEAEGPSADDIRRMQRMRDIERLHELLQDVRGLPGCRDFMVRPTFEALTRAAAGGPVCILVSGATVNYALLLQPSGQALSVQLESATEPWLEESNGAWRSIVAEDSALTRQRLTLVTKPRDTTRLGRRAREQRQILRILWTNIVRPIVDALELKPSTGRERPRVWWIPTGKFAFLPIHAAGTDSECCSDYFVSSYAPSAAALINARRDFTPLSCRAANVSLIAVSEPGRGNNPLPYAQTEVDGVQSFLSDIGLDVAVLREGTADEVLSHLRTADVDILHLACHGQQNIDTPLESGFVMHDGVLTISKLMRLSLPHAFFAFLSACETAKASAEQPDQVVHLAAAMLFVGFRSVVGTLWSMEDIDGPRVAKMIYQKLFEDSADSRNLDPASIPFALDAAVQEMRDSGIPPSRWASYVHYGI